MCEKGAMRRLAFTLQSAVSNCCCYQLLNVIWAALGGWTGSDRSMGPDGWDEEGRAERDKEKKCQAL